MESGQSRNSSSRKDIKLIPLQMLSIKYEMRKEKQPWSSLRREMDLNRKPPPGWTKQEKLISFDEIRRRSSSWIWGRRSIASEAIVAPMAVGRRHAGGNLGVMATGDKRAKSGRSVALWGRGWYVGYLSSAWPML